LSVGKKDLENPNRQNEDSLLERPDKSVFAVFDGVGGGQDGDKASRIARETVNKECASLPERMFVEQAKHFAQEVLKKAKILQANKAILEERGTENNMASTATLAVICYDEQGKRKLVVANAGDSRAYLHQNGKLNRVTVDDDFLRAYAGGSDARVRELQKIRDGINNASEIDTLPGLTASEKKALKGSFDTSNRDLVTNNLGRVNFKPTVEVVDFPDQAMLALFSDGIMDNIHDSDIESALNDGGGIAELVNAAELSNLKPDDITGILVKNKK
jgi:serine/threonine protein phosphatase PrpC